MKRVVVTGIGLVTPLGDGVETTWNSLINSKSGIKFIDHFNTEDLPCKIGGYIQNNSDKNNFFDVLKYVEKKDIKKIDRFILYGLAASTQAIEDSGIIELSDEQKMKVGVIIGSGIGGLETIFDTSINLFNKGAKKISPFFIPSSPVSYTHLTLPTKA